MELAIRKSEGGVGRTTRRGYYSIHIWIQTRTLWAGVCLKFLNTICASGVPGFGNLTSPPATRT
jgi:hypothetical protein